MAAGSALTDAVNVGQLSGAASNLGSSIATGLGGGATYNAASGAISTPSYTVQGMAYDDVGAALESADEAISNLVAGESGPFVSDNSVTATQAVASGANASAGGFGASATGAASTVVGNQARDNGVANSTVVGQGASIATALSGTNVALGQGSEAATGSQTGYTAFGLTMPQNSGGEVSVGSASTRRKITNVAAGLAPTDAVNVGQLSGAASNLGTTMAAGLGGGAAYSGAAGTISAPSYTIQGTAYTDVGAAFGGADTAISNLLAGDAGPFVSDHSITMAQAVASGANASAGGFGAIATGPGSTVYGNQANDNGVAGSAILGQGAFVDAGVTGSNVVLGQDSSAVVGAQGGYSAFGLSASQTSIGEVSVGTAAGRRQITNVAAGSAPTDAVNVAQLTGVSTAATAGLGTLGSSMASNLGGGSTYDPIGQTVTAPSYGVQGATYSNVGGAISGLDSAVSSISSGAAGPFVSDSSVTAAQAVASGANASAGGFGASATGAASTVVGNRATDNGVADSTVLG